MRAFARPRVLSCVALLAAAACGARATQTSVPVLQPGAPGEATRVLAPGAAASLPAPTFTRADVAFMQGMIHHHAQAIDMVELLKTRTGDPGMKLMARRIEVSQNDEIGMMRRWLAARGQQVPGPHAHHEPGAPLMPGMLGAGEMAALAAAKGREFDRLFLEGMIRHHNGALTMVETLFASPGAAQESEIFGFAADVDADQRMEIDRMAAMLKEISK
jgi:uncharacterized protein (DUF305 family)